MPVPIEQEINKIKRQIDDLEWEGVYCDHLKQYLDTLIQQMLDGKQWYVEF
jgi:hypothetical protein